VDLLLQKLINLARKTIVHDRQKTEGIVTVRKYFCEIPDTLEERLCLLRIGKAKVIHKGHNVITQGGRSALSRLFGNLGGPTGTNIITLGDGSTITVTTTSDLFVSKMKFGDPSSVTAEDTKDIALEKIIVGLDKSVSISYPSDAFGKFKISSRGTLSTSEGNGSTIKEEGLFLANDVLFARKTFSGGIVKNSSFALEFEHTIIF